MLRHNKARLGFASLVTVVMMVACGPTAPTDVKGKYAPPTEEMQKLKSCVAEKLSELRTIVAPEISVCRKSDAGDVKPTPIQPNFYLGSSGGKIRLVQVVSLHLSYAGLDVGATPSPEIKGKTEQALRAFLLGKCEPILKDVMKRSGVHARYVFQMYQSEEEFAGVDSAIESADVLFGDSNRPILPAAPPLQPVDPKAPVDPAASKKPVASEAAPATTVGKLDALPSATAATPVRAKAHRRAVRQSPNFVLELLIGNDQGVTIKDHPHAVSSGPLAAPDAKAAQTAFCTQLAVRMGEHLGLGGLAQGQSCDAKANETEATAKAEPQKAGLMKAAASGPSEPSRLKLSKSEMFSVMKPVCGDLEIATKESEKSLK